MDGKLIDTTTLYNVSQQIIDVYKDQLRDIDAYGSGDLINSVDFDIVMEEDMVTLKLIVNDYYYYVEYGRGPTKNPDGSWPTQEQDIMEWLQSKITRGKLVPKAGHKVPTTQEEVREAAQGILYGNTGIHKQGFYKDQPDKGKHPLRMALETAKSTGLVESFANAFIGAYTQDIKTSLKDLERRSK